MDKPKPTILQVKAPTKWDILKTKSKHIEQYLKGHFIKKGNPYTPSSSVTGAAKMPTVSISKYDDGEFSRKYRTRRKKINKLKYKSRRKNRSG